MKLFFVFVLPQLDHYLFFIKMDQFRELRNGDALRNLASIVQSKKRENHPWRSDNFKVATASLLKVTLLNGWFSLFKLYKWCQMTESILYFSLTRLRPIFYFYTPWKRQNTFDSLTFLGDIQVEHCSKMG